MEIVLVHPLPSAKQLRLRRIALTLIPVPLIATPLMMAWWFAIKFHPNTGQALAAFAALRDGNWIGILPSLVCIVVALLIEPIAARARRDARLIIKADGLEHRSGLPYWLPALQPGSYNWSLRWDEIARVRYLRTTRVLRLELKRGRPLALWLKDWVEQAAAASPSRPGVALATEHPLWRAAQSRGLLHLPQGNFDSGLAFELDAHPATLAAIATGTALALYGMFDDLDFIDENYLHDDSSFAYLLPAAVIGAAIGTVTVLLLRLVRKPARVPWSTTVGMGFVLSLAGALAGSAAMLRINQGYGGPLVQEPYRRESDCKTLVPRNPALAVLRFNESTRRHWCSFAADQDIPVPVRKGLFGTYQARLAGLVDNTVPPGAGQKP